MLISPTEPPELRAIGSVSLTPEDYGADVLIHSPHGLVGIQRKEFGDLVASAVDGRLYKQLSQLKQLPFKLIVIEGRPQWTNEGKLLARSDFTKAGYQGMMWSIQSAGCWISHTETLAETIELCLRFEKWIKNHSQTVSSLSSRSKPRGEWGIASNKDWGIWFLQSFNLGPKLAERVYDELGVPLAWTCTKEDLLRIHGLGKGRVEKIYGCLDQIKLESE